MDHLMLLDILASNHWKRPVYFASVQEPITLGLDKYLQLDGFAYKLTPFKNNPSETNEIGVVDSDKLYHKLMNQFSFESLANPKVYLDCTHVNIVSVLSLRGKFAQLSETLLKEGKTTKAIQVLDRIVAMLPHERIAYDPQVLKIGELYLMAGQRSKAEKILLKLKTVTTENLDYFQRLPKKYWPGIDYEIRVNLFIISELQRVAEKYGFEDLAKDTRIYWNQMENTLLPVIQH